MQIGASAAVAGGIQRTLPGRPGTRQLNLIVRGQGQPPSVLLIHGSERKLISPDSEGSFSGGVYLAVADPVTNTTYVAIGHPVAARGRSCARSHGALIDWVDRVAPRCPR